MLHAANHAGLRMWQIAASCCDGSILPTCRHLSDRVGPHQSLHGTQTLGTNSPTLSGLSSRCAHLCGGIGRGPRPSCGEGLGGRQCHARVPCAPAEPLGAPWCCPQHANTHAQCALTPLWCLAGNAGVAPVRCTWSSTKCMPLQDHARARAQSPCRRPRCAQPASEARCGAPCSSPRVSRDA